MTELEREIREAAEKATSIQLGFQTIHDPQRASVFQMGAYFGMRLQRERDADLVEGCETDPRRLGASTAGQLAHMIRAQEIPGEGK